MSTEQRPSAPTREELEVLCQEWKDKRYPAYHCANDLRFLLDKGRLPGGFKPSQNDPSENQTGSSSAASSVTLPEVVHDTLSDFKPQGDSVRGWYQE